MNILIIGSGGRESAFAWKLSQSPQLTQLFIAPGNAGTSQFGTNVPIKVTEFEKIGDFVVENQIDLVLVGPEEPLVKGIHDYFLSTPSLAKIPVIGPQQEGAQLEGSKDFSKQFMLRHQIPTAGYRSFDQTNLEEGIAYIATRSLPIVLKADGLAAGKGVLICQTHHEAQDELRMMIAESKFGAASQTVVIEDFLSGIELSVFVLTDGHSYKLLPSAKDYKRIGEGDSGLNTGGMGSVSPVPFADEAFIQKVEERIVIPTIEGLKKDNIPYKGFIFIGLMNMNGEPYVIEYNVRMGDPETQSVLPRIESDLIDLLQGVAEGNLDQRTYTVSSKTAATVVLVAGGYPGDYETGHAITHLEKIDGSTIFMAGATRQGEEIHTNGGRVMAVTALADDLFGALQQATADAGRAYYKGKYFRRDIGFDLID
jgi:phosphoribosylamine--glycine ligase